MQAAFDEIMKSVCHQSLVEDYQAAKDAPVWLKSVVLDENGVARLAKKMSLLPADYQTILYCRFCFGFSAKDTAEAFEMGNVTGQLRYVQNMLAFFIGIEEARIDDASMSEAAHTAFEAYTAVDEAIPLVTPKYSARFRRKLRSIKAAQRWKDYVVLAARRVAVVLLVCTIGFSSMLVANAEMREQFFTWLVETFPQFSAFIPSSNYTSVERLDELDMFTFDYVPQGFTLRNTLRVGNVISYEYENEQFKRISVGITTETTNYLNTEGAPVKKAAFKDDYAYSWVRGEKSYIVWLQDGFYFDIIGDCSPEEVLKMAENTNKK